MVNEYENNDLGYGNSFGYSNSEPGPGYGGSELDSGYGTSGFEDTPDNGTPNTVLGAGNNPWRTRSFADGYRGNPFEVNPFDTPWTETAANPIPQGDGYGSGTMPEFENGFSQGHPSVQPAEHKLSSLPNRPGVINSESSASASGHPSVRQRCPRQCRYGDDQLML